MEQGLVEIVARECLTPEYFKLVLEAPFLHRALPGQFVNVAVDAPDLCLRRPISLHDVNGSRATILIGIHGAGTEWLSRRRVGNRLDLLGPLGGRPIVLDPAARRVALVGGGVGIPPLHFAARRERSVERVVFIGARTASRLLCRDEFAAAGCTVISATDDGTDGFKGTVVEALARYLTEESVDQVVACGPTPMMRATAALAVEHGIRCQVCLEARMACAVGACLSCVIETTAPGWQRYQRVCTEGPVFDAETVIWETLSPLCAV